MRSQSGFRQNRGHLEAWLGCRVGRIHRQASAHRVGPAMCCQCPSLTVAGRLQSDPTASREEAVLRSPH